MLKRFPRRRRVAVWSAAAIVVLMGLSLQSALTAPKRVMLNVDGKQRVVATRAGNTAGLLAAEGIAVDNRDLVSVPLNGKIVPGEKITVRHAVPVSVTVDGQTRDWHSGAADVGALLSNRGISLGPDDEVEPAADTPLAAGMKIRVIRVSKQIATVQEKIPYQTVHEDDSGLLKGKERVAQQGRDGLEVKTVEKIYKDGQLAMEQVLNDQVQTRQVNEIVKIGTRKPVTVLSASSPDVDTVTVNGRTFSYKRKLTNVILTAYDAGKESTGKTPDSPQYGITYTGTHVEQGRTIAVDPGVIPLGWWVYIDGVGFRHAEDIGSGVRGKWIDIYYDSHAYTERFGMRRGATVYVVGPNLPDSAPGGS